MITGPFSSLLSIVCACNSNFHASDGLRAMGIVSWLLLCSIAIGALWIGFVAYAFRGVRRWIVLFLGLFVLICNVACAIEELYCVREAIRHMIWQF